MPFSVQGSHCSQWVRLVRHCNPRNSFLQVESTQELKNVPWFYVAPGNRTPQLVARRHTHWSTKLQKHDAADARVDTHTRIGCAYVFSKRRRLLNKTLNCNSVLLVIVSKLSLKAIYHVNFERQPIPKKMDMYKVCIYGYTCMYVWTYVGLLLVSILYDYLSVLISLLF